MGVSAGGCERWGRGIPHLSTRVDASIDLRFELYRALISLGEFDRMFDSLQEAERLAETLDDQHRLAWVACYMTVYSYRTGDYERAIACAKQSLELTTDPDTAQRIRGRLELFRGSQPYRDPPEP